MDYEKQYPELHTLFTLLSSNERKYDIDKIVASYLYAEELHRGQFRQSGDPYITHPLAVAEIVADLGLDTDSVCAAFLHDTVEDCGDKTDLSAVSSRFGDEVAMLVDGVTKIPPMQVEDKEEAHIENVRKMLLAMSRDVRVIFIKLCDRLHNMRTLDAKSEDKCRKHALETMYVYAPLAHRLGIQKIKQELERLCLFYLDPIGYKEVTSEIEHRYGENQNFLETATHKIETALKEYNIPYTLEGRVKTVYSLYKKMYEQGKNFDDIFDFYALRILVDNELECYTALGIIHEMFKSVPGRFKDYISTPKPNLYRSLHTTVFGRGGIPFEVQIRTYEMHHIAEYGIAAHWKYKSGEKADADIDQKLTWIARLLESDYGTKDSDEYFHAFKTDIFHDETFIFTPKGDLISMPLGSTVIDFAYAIHSAVGNKMIGAKINGIIVPIDRVPQNGNIVEILTSNSGKGPSRDWLKIVTTGEARSKIRQWFKKEKRPENILVGKADIEHELHRYGRAFTEKEMQKAAEKVAVRVGIQTADDLYNTVGYGGLSVSKISTKLHEELQNIVRPVIEELTPDQIKLDKPKNLKNNTGVILDGQAGCLVKFARCCNPLPGDDIIGFVTKGFGVSVHKRDCPNARLGVKSPEQADRWISASWEKKFAEQKSEGVFEAMLQIQSDDRLGVLADITTALADMKVSILQINIQHKLDAVTINMTVACKNTDHFTSIVSRLRAIHSVVSVVRGFS